MYSGRGFRESEIGDIDVIRHDGQYHLFHLILPNHDYIAHAVSRDCIHWRRVKNALFVGDPGEWDDDMIWTMNVVTEEKGFVMYYTGLNQAEGGMFQRIGRAVSSDLYSWQKENHTPFPIGSAGPHYESPENRPRQWVSFRDPYRFSDGDETFLLVCARIGTGSVSRRGCVGLIEMTDGDAKLHSPLFTPFVYDDVECPCLLKIDETYYLIGSIREDVKVHYWYSRSFRGEYHAFHNNVLMPKGNYAARVTRDGDRWLLYSFYVVGKEVERAHRYLPPPKEVVRDDSGKLILKSFHRWSEKIERTLMQNALPEFRPTFGNPGARHERNESNLVVDSLSGYETFLFPCDSMNLIWTGTIEAVGLGKCGFVFDSNSEGEGYYISLDVVQGFVQIRAWGGNPVDIHKDYVFENLQTNNFPPRDNRRYEFQLIRYGAYIEFSIDGVVRLSLVDAQFSGDQAGIYCESARISLQNTRLHRLKKNESDDLEHFEPTLSDGHA